MSTEKQLKERWLTSEGKKVRQQIIEHIRNGNWYKLLDGFPFVEELSDKRDLRGIDLIEASLWGANLMATDLIESKLIEAKLMGANLMSSDLERADLRGANLEGAKINNALLQNSCLNQANLSKTNLTNASVYGISAWDIKTDKNTIMKNLVISEGPLITVDDIEIAQFINLVLNNEKISKIITSMRTKGVLILGSFDDESMPVLNKITEILPKYDLVPMVFHFKPPKEHRFMETVKTMALLSKFVIVDLSKRSSQLYEIANLVKDVKVPYITIAIEGTKVSGMLEDLHDYYWYRKDYFPYPEKEWEKELPKLVKNEVIPWAKKINNKLLKNRNR